jgi:hypothetical protein
MRFSIRLDVAPYIIMASEISRQWSPGPVFSLSAPENRMRSGRMEVKHKKDSDEILDTTR